MLNLAQNLEKCDQGRRKIQAAPTREKNGKGLFDQNKWKDLNLNKVLKVWTGTGACKSKPPTNGKKEKVVNDKTYYWCEDHKAWTMHHPNKCKCQIDRLSKKPIAKEAVVETPKEDDLDTVARISIIEEATPDKTLLYKLKL